MHESIHLKHGETGCQCISQALMVITAGIFQDNEIERLVVQSLPDSQLNRNFNATLLAFNGLIYLAYPAIA
jgi:hypothetical protein